MKELLEILFAHRTLSQVQAREALLLIGQGEVNPARMAAFLTVFLLRPITVEELVGFRSAMLELCQRVELDRRPAMDLCGTGGDGKDTFNISTTVAFVVAGAGMPVVKHGNHGVSSACGSSTVMEALGFRFSADRDRLLRQLEAARITFLHAPLFHPAMKHVAPIRRELGVKTFFNILGPMVNPAQPSHQLVGVFNLELARLYHYLYQQQAQTRYQVVHCLGGYDEISLTAPFRTWGTRLDSQIEPMSLHLRALDPSELHGGSTPEANARILTQILENQGSEAQTQVVVANAALALLTAGQAASWEEGIAQARESLESGAARQALLTLLSLSA